MGKQELDPRDAHTFRIYLRHAGTAEATSQEVVALYHQFENGFILFKDNAHAVVLALASASVLEIQRLRTHTILAVADEELGMIVGALRGQSDRMLADARDGDAAQDAKSLAFLADALDRLNPVAAARAAEDESSMLRVSLQPGVIATSADGGSVQYGRVAQSVNA